MRSIVIGIRMRVVGGLFKRSAAPIDGAAHQGREWRQHVQ